MRGRVSVLVESEALSDTKLGFLASGRTVQAGLRLNKGLEVCNIFWLLYATAYKDMSPFRFRADLRVVKGS